VCAAARLFRAAVRNTNFATSLADSTLGTHPPPAVDKGKRGKRHHHWDAQAVGEAHPQGGHRLLFVSHGANEWWPYCTSQQLAPGLLPHSATAAPLPSSELVTAAAAAAAAACVSSRLLLHLH
jgi:hypothetical protein